MGFKWTYTLLCIMGTANLLVEAIPAPESVAGIRESQRFEAAISASQISSRTKRDVNTIPDDNGNRFNNAKSTTGDGRSFSYSGTFGPGPGVSSSSSSSSGGAFGLATSRIGGAADRPSGSFGGSSGYSRNSWPGSSGASGIPTNFNGAGGNQNYRPNVGYNNPYYPNQYPGPFGGYNGPNPEEILQQYFRAVEARNQALQAQYLHPQPAVSRGARGGSYAWANGAAVMTNPNGRINPNAGSYAYATTFTSGKPTRGLAIGTSQTAVRRPHGAGHVRSRNGNRFNAFGFNNAGGFGNGFGSGYDRFGSFNPGVSRGAFDHQEPNFPAGGNSAFASAALGPNGGFQHAEINPAAPGIVSRIFEPHPPSSGNNVGVSSSSESHTFVDSDGKLHNKKSATTRINDNGNITTYTVKDP